LDTEHLHDDQKNLDTDQLKRQARRQQTIDTLTAAHDRVADFLATATPRMGKGNRPKEVKSNITDNDSCKMKTSKGTIQGYNGIAAVDGKHQIIVDAQAMGEGQEQHVLQPVLNRIRARYQRLGISSNIYQSGLTVTADTGYSNKENLKFLYQKNIDAYVPDNQFRRRDAAFDRQKIKHGHTNPRPKKTHSLFSASDFHMDPVTRTCVCPAGQTIFFMGRLSKCRSCSLNTQCMRRPEAAKHRLGSGRQVSFIIKTNEKQDVSVQWMKERVDSITGKECYAQRMAVVEPVFGNIRANKGLDRFTLRGKKKVNGQWQLFTLVHNIEKISHHSLN